MTLSIRDIDIIAERVDAWVRTGDPFDLRADDVLDLLANVRELTRQHRRDLALLARCRERLAAVVEQYAEQSGELAARVAAYDAQSAAETDPP